MIKKSLIKLVVILTDILCLIPAGILLLFAAYYKYYKISYDPLIIKSKKAPILLIHGKGYNQIQWLIGKYYLNKESLIGSVYSVDYDGLASNDDKKTIDDYAEVISKKILDISVLTDSKEIILIGHSLGGLVASVYAEKLSKRDNINVKNIITISTPWHEPPLIKHVKKVSPQMLYDQMTESHLKAIRDLTTLSTTNNVRKYHSFGSNDDFIVPVPWCHLTNNAHTYNYYGHYTIVASPVIWKKICQLVNSFYL